MTSSTVITIAKTAIVIGICLAAAVEPVRVAEAPKVSSTGAAVIVSKATKACFSAAVQVTGFLVARKEALVTLDMEGFRISEILVKEGDKVTAGQTLIRLTRSTEGGSQPTGAAPTGASAAGAPATSATPVLRAPAAGTVTHNSAILGAVASMRGAEPLIRIAIDGEIELEAEVSSIHVPKLAAKQSARVEIEDGREMTGSVRLVPAEINPISQLGRVRVAIERDPSLRVGSFARATIDASRSCGVSIPRAAVLYRTEGPSVQVVRDRTVETRRVKVGFHSDLAIEIREGVQEDDMVVANAGTSLRNGDQVRPIFADDSQMGER